MIVIKIFSDNAENFSGRTVANEWEKVIKQLKLYFRDIEGVKKRIVDGEVIVLPFFTLQKDRRIKGKKVKNERRLIRKEKQLSGTAGG